MLVVTIESLPGYEIVTVLGDVLGATARPQNAFLDGARTLSGVPDRHQAEILGSCRREAVARMVTTAHRRGANAVVGMRFDHRTIGSSWTEICAYGTAVVAVPARRPPPPRSFPAGDAAQPVPVDAERRQAQRWE